ncbi:MAG: CpsB/CapC family capsule biosynthesis tyrosine phosphatase [Lachnospira eligens]
MSEGYIPVIAHVERYGCMVDDIENVRRLSRMG